MASSSGMLTKEKAWDYVELMQCGTKDFKLNMDRRKFDEQYEKLDTNAD